MEFSQKLLEDIRRYEEELDIHQDEKMYSDKSDYYLLNRLAELRVIYAQRNVLKQGEEIMKLDSRHDSPEMKQQIENVKERIKEEEEKNRELEFQYEFFANVYLGQDRSTRGEMIKVLNEYHEEQIDVNFDIVDKTDEYMFEKYALTDDKMKKARSDNDGGLGIGMGLEQESENDF